ncbi:MAG: ribose-phosphate pyrophosphokinase [Clostridia bacterium]|nr:ribose-phosphate pyrophosphokinase [Clostridia bacterium]MBQ4085956.1 ribose-phosphate pyrophosphokinase [Clostridia bacterium]
MADFTSNWNNDDFLTIPNAPIGLIAMPGCEEFGAKVNAWLMRWHEQQEALEDTPLYGVLGYNRKDFLIDVKCPRFSNGEAKGMIESSVRGYDLYIICDIGAYNITYKMYGKDVPVSPDEHFMNLKRIIGAAGGRAKRINVIMPMLYEGRQHRRSVRESLDCAMALQELQNLGVDTIITFDAHDPRMESAIPTHIGFDSVRPSYQILKALLREQKDLQIDRDHMMIVSPDEGALDRNIYYASVLGLDMGMFYKRRDYTRIVNGRNPIIAHEYLGADVAGKDIFVSDDILASGDSVLDLARELKKRNARRVFATVTFGLFTSGLEAFHKAHAEGLIEKVICTNLTYRTPELRESPWFIEADMSKYVSYFIASLNHDRSTSKLLNPSDRIHNLVDRYKKEQQESGILG